MGEIHLIPALIVAFAVSSAFMIALRPVAKSIGLIDRPGGLQLFTIGDPFGTGEVSLGAFTLLFTLMVAVTIINAYNLVDGVDGLAGSLALIAFLAVAVVAGAGSVFGAISLTVAAGIVGFLLYNFPVVWNRSVHSFMGDAGSTLLGFTVLWITISISQGPDRLISPVHCL